MVIINLGCNMRSDVSRPGDARMTAIEASAPVAGRRRARPTARRAAECGSAAFPGIIDGHHRTSRLRGQEQGLRPAPVGRLPPMIRVHGDIRRINLPPMEHEDVPRWCTTSWRRQRKAYEENLEWTSRSRCPTSPLPRQRVQQQRGAAAAFRDHSEQGALARGAAHAKVFAELTTGRAPHPVHRPDRLRQVDDAAAMVNHVNENQYGHTSPSRPDRVPPRIEEVLINQRELGPHTLSFPNALRSALRRTPTTSSSARCATSRRSASP